MNFAKRLHGIPGWVGLFVVLVIFFVRVATQFEYTPDDTYIYMQYARNVILHHEVAFNAGEPSYGITSPLWLVFISTAGSLGVDLHDAAKMLDALMAGAAIVALYFLQRLITGEMAGSLMTAAVFSTHIWFLRWAGSGMETSLAAVLSILVVLSLLKQWYHSSAVCSVLLTLTRPEAAVLVVTAVAVDFFLAERSPTRFRTLLRFVVVYVLVLLPWYIYAYTVIGTVVPNTALAKSGLSLDWTDMVSTGEDIVKTLGASDVIGLLTIFSAVTAYMVWRVRAKTVTWDHEMGLTLREFTIPLAWIVSLPLLYFATSANVVSRYFMLICPFIVLLAFALPLRLLRKRFSGRFALVAATSIAAVLLLLNSVVFEVRIRPHMHSFATGMKECFIYIGSWLHENTSRDASVLIADIGAVGYYSERRICDTAGLVSIELLPFARRGYSIERIMKEEAYHTRCNASYVIERSTVQNPVHSPLLEPVFTRVVHGLGLSSQDAMYYTVFRVIAH